MEGSLAVRAELYIQVMKQLNENPNPASEAKGWEMMAIMLTCFAPPETVENFVAMFIRNQAPKGDRHRYRVFLHCSTYDKLRTTPPTLEELPMILSQFRTKEVDEKFLENDVLKVRSTTPPNPSTASPPPPPPPPPRPAQRPPKEPQYVVEFEYNPAETEEGMMPIFVGEKLNIMDKTDSDWWMAKKLATGESGWIPSAYIKLE